MRWPDLFIIGAPKAGTTALACYLSEHPQIAFSRIKEPHFFATDLPRQRSVTSAEAYLALFDAANERHRIRAEGSIWYLYSGEAVQRIMEVRPDARMVIMLRNPVQAAHALHQQKIQSADEDVLDFERGFRLQEVRRHGRSIPKSCREPVTLLYGEVCSYARQIERLYRWVPREQVRIYLYDEFARNPRGVYSDVLAFAGVADDGRTSFLPVNQSRRPRLAILNRLIRRPSPARRWLAERLKRAFEQEDLGLSGTLKKINTTVRPRPALAPAFNAELARYFAPDVRRLERILERDLGGWLPKGDSAYPVLEATLGDLSV